MAKKKRKKNVITGLATTGLTMAGSSMALSSLPSNTISPQVTSGLAKASSSFPTVGKLVGAGLVIKQTGKLIKVTRKLKRRKKK